MGNDPTSLVWKTRAQPLYQTRIMWWSVMDSNHRVFRSQIYSLVQSTALPTLRYYPSITKNSRSVFTQNVSIFSSLFLVPQDGLEPSRFRQRLLRPSCLPIPPSGQILIITHLLLFKDMYSWDNTPGPQSPTTFGIALKVLDPPQIVRRLGRGRYHPEGQAAG